MKNSEFGARTGMRAGNSPVTQPAPPSRPDQSQLATSNWLRLVRVYNLILKELRTRLRDQSGLTMPQFDVLAQLHRFGRGMTFVELSRELLVTSGNLTGIVDRLSARNLVQRQPNPTDRRVIHVLLTPQGTRLIQKLLPQHSSDLQELLSGLSLKDQQQLREILGKLREAL